MPKHNTDKLHRAKTRPSPAQWADDEVMTLVEAAAVFFPHGPLTLSSLRSAAPPERLKSRKVAGKDLTTPRAIRKLVKPSCRAAKPNRPTFVPRRRRLLGHPRSGKARQIRTGCGRDDIQGAAKALETYIGGRHTTTVGATDPRVLAIADVLTFYEISKRPKAKIANAPGATRAAADPPARSQHLLRRQDGRRHQGAALPRLRRLVDRHRERQQPRRRHRAASGTVSDQTARRRLEDLRAAINAYHAEHTLNVVPKVTLPPKTEGRQRWLTRNEAARLLGAALGYVWDAERRSWKRQEDGRLLRRERWIIPRRPAARLSWSGFTARAVRKRSGERNGCRPPRIPG